MNPAVTAHPRLQEVFLEEERMGMRLALKGRLLALGALAGYALLLQPDGLMKNTLAYVGAFSVLSVLQFWLAGSRYNRAWFKYAFTVLELAILANAVLTPNPFNPDPWPAQMVFRYDNFLYFFVLIAVAAFGYSPGFVLWTGIAAALVWGGGTIFILMRPDTQTFGDIVANATREEVLAHYLDPRVVLVGDRIKEMLVAIIVAGLLSAIVWRSRRTVERQAAVERERVFLRETFGRYVPPAVAQAIIEDRGVLEPEQREATVLFIDVEGFTALAESIPPDEVIPVLNAYFGAVAEVIARHGGVINQFQGDAVLATFNVPVRDPEHAAHAIRTAIEIQRVVSERAFEGHWLRCRIGVNTGTVVAGNVGGGGRLSYTVHGDAVNLAARLEQLNKEHDTRILVSETAAAASGMPLEPLGSVMVRGKVSNVTVYRLPRGEADTLPRPAVA